MHAAIRLGLDETGPKELKVIDSKGKEMKLNAEAGSVVLDVPKGHVLQVVQEKKTK
jgi:hypothetical protein